MARPIQVGMAAILAATKGHLMDSLGFPAERVYVIASPPVNDKYQADQVVAIHVGDFVRNVPWSDGSSRICTYLSRQLEVVCHTRLALDYAAEDYIWLVHNSLGHLALEDAVANAMDDWLPMDNSGNVLTLQPVKLLGGRAPTKEERVKAPGWGLSVIQFAVAYQPIRDPVTLAGT